MADLLFVAPADGASAVIAEQLRAGAPLPLAGCQALLGTPPAERREAFAAALAAGPAAVVYRPSARAGVGPDLAEAEDLFAAAPAAPSARWVLVASAAVYDPSHHQPGHLAESRPGGRHPIARRWLALEELAEKRLGKERKLGKEGLAILRPATVGGRGGGDPLGRLLLRRLAFPVVGYGAALQLLAPEDLAAAIATVLARGGEGVFNVAPRGVVTARGAVRLAGGRSLPLGEPLQRLLGLACGRELAYLRHPWTVSSDCLRALGWSPQYSSAEAILAAAGRQATEGAKTPGTGAGRYEAEGAQKVAAAAADPFHPAASAASGPQQAAPRASAAAAPRLAFDDYGMDERYIAAYGRTLFRFLHRVYWRIEVDGLEHVPRQGRAVMTGVHRGFMPWDGVMALHGVYQETGRIMRFLIHPCLVKFPFLANYMTKLGGLLACQENADWVLGRDELLGMFPEGIHGAFTPYRRAYTLGKFGRDEYVRMALRNRAPIVPYCTVGSAEIYPIWGRIDGAWVRRVFEWPYLPLCPNFPLPGLPLPSKWHTRFLEPLHVERRYGPEAAEDPAVVQEIGREVRGRLDEAIAGMLRRRKHVFWGAIFDAAENGVTRWAPEQPNSTDRRVGDAPRR
jgi:1-acyl-sn-glycerol-3-phosphate acyltransferase/nucleoside-diphosphate-sugar epimerase